MYIPSATLTFLIACVSLFVTANVLLTLYVLHKVRRVHLMSFAIRSDLDSAVWNDQLFRQLQALDGLYRDLKLSRALPLTRNWAASPDFLSTVAGHALDHRPQVVVECGSGVSTVILARCMQINGAGRVYSLDHDSRFAEQTRRNLERHGLTDWAEVIHAPLQEHALGGHAWAWYDASKLPNVQIDMLVVDGPPMPIGEMIRYPAGPMLFARLAPTAAVFLDDADREDERRTVKRWIEENPGFRPEKVDCEKGCVVLKRGATP